MRSLAKAVGWVSKALIEVVFPSYCELCERATPDRQAICQSCRTRFHPQEGDYCLRCAEQVHHSELREEACIHCEGYDYVFECAIVSYVMNPYLRHCIHLFKYQRGLHLTSFLTECLARAFTDERLASLSPEEWSLSCVPIHHIRERERGFNQSALLAQELSILTGFPYRDLLARDSHSPHQAGLNKTEREKNMRKAFSVKASSSLPENVLLVDDVFTTGSTTNACARVLKRAGVRRVMVICLARR